MKADQPVGHQRRPEKRQPYDMVEMKMTEENVDFRRRARASEFRAELDDTCAGIDDEQSLAAANLDARGVAAEFLVLEPSHR